MKKLFLFMGWLTTLLLVFVLAINALYLHYELLNDDPGQDGIKGYAAFDLVGQSMEPGFHEGDFAVFTATPPEELQVGDVIAFRTQDGTLVSHRLVELPNLENGRKYITKGDNNPTADLPINGNQIIGKYAFKLSGFATKREALRNNKPAFFLYVLSVLAGILVAVLTIQYSIRSAYEREKAKYLPGRQQSL